MKIVLKGEYAQRFCDPLLDFMIKNPHLFVDGTEKESNNVDLNVEEYDKDEEKQVKL